MTERVTMRQLEAQCETINRLMGLPLAPYTRHADGTYTPNAGVYHISGQYGGVSLDRMSDTPGCTGISRIIDTTTKRDLYGRMRSYIDGIEASRAI